MSAPNEKFAQNPASYPVLPPENPGYPNAPPSYFENQPQYPPPQAGFVTPGQQGVYMPQTVTTASARPVIVAATVPQVGTRSTHLTCGSCRKDVMTRTDTRAGVVPWIAAGLLCFFGCFCGCCLIPFCADGCLDTEHYCPECGALVGTKRAF